MLKALTLVLLSGVAVAFAGCAQNAERSSGIDALQAGAGSDLAYGMVLPSAGERRSEVNGSLAGAETFFGEWVTQIVRRAPNDKPGPPWFYDSGVVLDAKTTELRPKLDLTLSEDGTYSLITNFSSLTNDRTVVFGSWRLSGTSISLEENGRVTWVFTYRGGKLLSQKDDGTLLVLGRVKGL